MHKQHKTLNEQTSHHTMHSWIQKEIVGIHMNIEGGEKKACGQMEQQLWKAVHMWKYEKKMGFQRKALLGVAYEAYHNMDICIWYVSNEYSPVVAVLAFKMSACKAHRVFNILCMEI